MPHHTLICPHTKSYRRRGLPASEEPGGHLNNLVFQTLYSKHFKRHLRSQVILGPIQPLLFLSVHNSGKRDEAFWVGETERRGTRHIHLCDPELVAIIPKSQVQKL